MALVIGFVLSLLVGLSLGLIGGGGAILVVPILHYILGVDAVTATSISLIIVGGTSLLASVGYFRRGELKIAKGLMFAVPSMVTVLGVRKWLLPLIPDIIPLAGFGSVEKGKLFLLAFATLMLLASTAMLRSVYSSKKSKKRDEPIEEDKPHHGGVVSLSTRGILVGAVTGTLGAGGGFLIVPVLNLTLGIPMKAAVGTSLFIIALNSMFGVFSDLSSGVSIPWTVTALSGGASLLGMVLSLFLSKNIPAEKLKKLFGILVLSMAIVIFIMEIL